MPLNQNADDSPPDDDYNSSSGKYQSKLPPIYTSLALIRKQANVSLQRLNKFLNNAELDPTCISHDETIGN